MFGSVTAGSSLLTQARTNIINTQSDTSYTGFLGSSFDPSSFSDLNSSDVTQTASTFAGGAVKGSSLGATADRFVLQTLANDVQYVVNRLTNFQQLLGGKTQGAYLEGDVPTWALGLSDAVLGKKGVRASDTLSILDSFEDSDGDQVSALYGIRLFLDALAAKFSTENFPSQLAGQNAYALSGSEVSAALLGVNEGQVSSLFGSVSGAAVAAEAESDFGAFTFTTVT